jgi:hypothetical protein
MRIADILSASVRRTLSQTMQILLDMQTKHEVLV